MPSSYWFFRRRKDLNLKQEDLAQRLTDAGFEVSRPTISSWETGRHNPPIQDAGFRKAFADALELSVPDMLELAGYELEEQANPLGPSAIRYTAQYLSAHNLEIASALMLILLHGDVKVITDFDLLLKLRNRAVHGDSSALPPITLAIDIKLDEPMKKFP